MNEATRTCGLIRAKASFDGKQGLTYFQGISSESVEAEGICMHVPHAAWAPDQAPSARRP